MSDDMNMATQHFGHEKSRHNDSMQIDNKTQDGMSFSEKEDYHGNRNIRNASSVPGPKKYPYQFQKVAKRILSLQKQMRMMERVLDGERETLLELEEIIPAALEQESIIQQLEIEVDKLLSASQHVEKPRQEVREESHLQESHEKKIQRSCSKNKSIVTEGEQNHLETFETSQSKLQNFVSEISLPLVKQVEYENLSKYVRTNTKVTLSVLNEAILDIVRVCRLKYTILQHHQNQSSMGRTAPHHNTTRNTHNRRSSISNVTFAKTNPPTTKQYQQQIISEHFELELNSKVLNGSSKKTNNANHNGRPWVSEQSLRDSCTFFRFGEITSRAILSTLRSLGRLKQINNKSRITYVLLIETKHFSQTYNM